MIAFNDALKLIKNKISTISLPIEEVDILESHNRILAEDIIADVDLPPFDNSAMDGYAIKISKRNKWNIIGEISAGNYSSINLSENEAVLITTGSKVPIDADTVIPIEDLIVEVNILKLKPSAFYKKGMNVRTQGNDLKKNQIAVHRFTKIDAKVIAVLASCGKERVKVFPKLKAAILATGDELIPINEKPEGDKLRVSNIYSLYAAIKEMNHTPMYFGVYEKDEKKILVLGLPGNPVSSLINFYVFIKPAIEFLFKQNVSNRITAALQNDLKKKDIKRHFSRGLLFEENGEWKVTSEFSQSSGNHVELSRANCLIEIEEERKIPAKGEKVKCIL